MLAASAAVLAGCAAIPDMGAKPQPKVEADFAADRSLAAPAADWPADRWWDAYGDAQLSALIDEALKDSPNLAEAQARLRQAKAQVGDAQAALLPHAEFNGQFAEEEQSRAIGFPSQIANFLPKGYNSYARTTFDGGWNLDLFGKNRAALAAQVSEKQAEQADLAQARLMLSTNVALAYADLARLAAERAAAAEAVKNRQASSKLTSDRVRNGLDTQAELQQARSATPASEADVESLDEQMLIARHKIAALVGAGPDRGLDITPPMAEAVKPFGLPADLKVALIGRRPDVVAARLRVEEQAKRIDVARAAFFPNVTISAYIGQQALYVQNMFSPIAAIGSIGPAVSLPLFEGGKLRADYKGARAQYDEAVADYNATVILALQEVADTAASVQSAQRQLDQRNEALKAGEAAYTVAQLRYQGGLSTYVSVLTAEDAVIADRKAAADAQTRVFSLDISLNRALGGGFQGV